MRCMGALRLLAIGLLLATAGLAQSIVSARAGAIHHVEGSAFIDGDPVVTEFAKFPNLATDSVLTTELGRVEMLLNPGVILRLAEDSSVRMLQNRLSDTRLQFNGGAVLIEAMEMLDGNSLTLQFDDATISIRKAGLYRLDSDPAELRVYKGKATVTQGDQEIVAKKGRLVEFAPFLTATRFDSKQNDSLYRWSARRSGYLASANLSAARMLNQWGMPWTTSGWRWNPYFGMFTYIPAGGMYLSPFGFHYWSPGSVGIVYLPPRTIASGGGGGWMGGSSNRGYATTTSGARAISAGRPSSTSVGAAPSSSSSSRSGGGSVGRGTVGGGRSR